MLAATYARTAVGPLQEAIRIGLALSDNKIALLQGPAMALPVLIAAVPIGIAIDRRSRVRLLYIFAIFSLVGCILTALAYNFPTLIIARALVGLTAAATSTAAFSLIADLCGPDQRGRATTVLVVSQMGGNAAVFAVGGILLAMAGARPGGWRWAMLWLTSPLLPVLLLMLTMREPPRTGLGAKYPSARVAAASLWRQRSAIAPLLIGLVMVEMALGAAYVWAAPAMSRGFRLSPDRVGAIIAAGLMLSGIMGPVVGGLLADRCQRTGGSRRAISALSGMAVLTAPTGLFAFMSGAAVASALLVMLMVMVCATLVMGTALFTIVIPAEMRGFCMAVLFAAGALLGVGLAPLAVSLLSGALGGPAKIGMALALVTVITNLLAAISFALGRRFIHSEALCSSTSWDWL